MLLYSVLICYVRIHDKRVYQLDKCLMYNKPTKLRLDIGAVDIYDPQKIGHGNTSACNFSTAVQIYVSLCTGQASSAM